MTFPGMADTFDPLVMQDPSPAQAELFGVLAHLMFIDRDASVVLRVPTRLDKSFEDALKNVAVRALFTSIATEIHILTRFLSRSGSRYGTPLSSSIILYWRRRISLIYARVVSSFSSAFATLPQNGRR